MGKCLHMNCKMVVNGQMLKVGRLETGRAGNKQKLGDAAEKDRQPGWTCSAYEHRDKKEER